MASDTMVRERDPGIAAGETDADTDEPTDVVETSAAAKRAARKTAPLTSRDPGSRVVLIFAVLLAGFVAATAFFGYQYFSDSSGVSDGERAEVSAVADDYATKLASFDYRDLNKNREAITAMSTASFAAKYDEMVKALTEIVSNGQGVATAKVSHAAVQSIDAEAATVIAFVDQKATNVVAPDGKDQPYRMVLSLKREGDRWLVDDVQTV